MRGTLDGVEKEIPIPRNQGKRGLWLKLLDRLNLGFAC